MKNILSLISNELFSKEVSETVEVLRFNKVHYDKDSHQLIQQLSSEIFENNLGTVTIRTEIGEYIDIPTSFEEVNKGDISLSIRKNPPMYFFTEDGFFRFLSDVKDLPQRAIVLAFIEKPFDTLTASFFPLVTNARKSITEAKQINTVKYVKPLTAASQVLLPSALGDWIALSDHVALCPESWKKATGFKLLSAVGTEVDLTNDLLKIEFRGDRRKAISVNLNSCKFGIILFDILNEIAEWIYFQGRDIDSRHSLFNQQLCFLLDDERVQYPEGELHRIFKIAFENTESSYRFYLLNASKELQKNLTDLNKTLYDYILKIKQGSNDMATALWRDFAIAMGVMVLNYSIKQPDVFAKYFSWFGGGLCFYIIISFYISSTAAFGIYYTIKQTLSDWRNKLYSYLSEKEYDLLATQPLRKSFIKFRTSFFIIAGAYLLLLFAIVILIEPIRKYLFHH